MSSWIPVYEPWLVAGDSEAVARAVRSGWVSSAGAELRAFEQAWASYCGMAHGVGVSSGTAALELALEAAGVGPGDEVICPTFTIISCALAIVRVGATPVLVDSDPGTYCMDAEEVRAKVTDKTAAVLAVHMYGHPVAPEVVELSRTRGLLLVEDAAEAHGAEIRIGEEWARCGGVGELSVFSFYANKAITTGEGGMVLTNDGRHADRVRSLMNLCFKPSRRFEHDELGHNYRLTNVQAALGLSQIGRLDEIVERKRSLARSYRERLDAVEGVTMQSEAPWARPVPWMIGVVLDDEAGMDAAELARRLKALGVDSRPFFLGMHEQPVLRQRGLFDGVRYPVAERLSRQGLYLPSSPMLEDDVVDRVCSAVRHALSSKGPEVSAAPAAPGKLPDAPEQPAVFGTLYASAYDALYADKDYAGEVDALEACFERFGDRAVKEILDLGCGTGRHMAVLLDRGYRVTGVDRSPAMLARARERLASRDGSELLESSVAGLLAPGRRWDATVMMFAVLSYHTRTEELLAALRASRAHTAEGGLLIADLWYGPAVLEEPPGSRSREVTVDGDRWLRHVDSTHDPRAQLVTVGYELERRGGDEAEALAREEHVMRYLFPQEIELLLELSGFRLIHLGNWPAVDEPPGADGYTAVLIARAC